MHVCVDTNVLIRAVMQDDPLQGMVARQTLEQADTVSISVVTFCEFVWVLSRLYKVAAADIASAVGQLMAVTSVRCDRPCIEFGLQVFESGGDFADGVIAYHGSAMGAASFHSFDRNAVDALKQQGVDARLLSV